MKQILLLLSLAFAGLGAKGQASFQERAYRLDSKFKIIGTSDVDRQGNMITSGLIRNSLNGPHNSMVMLFKPNIDTLWTRNGPEVPDFPIYPRVTFRVDGGYSFAATTKKPVHSPPDNYDVVLQKYSPAGSLLMNRIFNPAADDNTIISLLSMPDKGYLISGSGGINGSPNAFSLIRTDSAGTVLWRRNHTKVAPDGLTYMEHVGNGNTIMAGVIYSGGPNIPPFRIKLFLVDANGDSLRANTLNLTGDPMRDEVMIYGTENCITSLSDGGFLITGQVDTINASQSFVRSLGLIVRLNASLQPVWRYIYPLQPATGYSVFFTKTKELKDGSIIVLGQSAAVLGNATPVNGFQLYRFNAFGSLTNTYSFTSPLYPSLRLNTLEALPDSSFMIGGNCRTAGNAQTGFYVAIVKIPGLAAGRPSYIMAAPKEVTVAAHALGAAYPNPAQGQVFIPYQLPSGTRSATLRLTDITGKEVGSYSLKQERQGQLPVNISRLPNGLYLYTLVLDGRPVATKKLSVQH